MNTACALLLWPLTICAQDALPPGQSILSKEPLATAKVSGSPQWGSVERTDIKDEGSATLRIRTLRRSPLRYNFQVCVLTEAAIARGDILLLSFSARAIETHWEMREAELGLSVQASDSPWRSTFNSIFYVGTQWQEFQLPFRSDLNVAAAGGQVCLQQGVALQSIEIREISLKNFGSQVELRDLPSTRFTYLGSEEDAP